MEGITSKSKHTFISLYSSLDGLIKVQEFIHNIYIYIHTYIYILNDVLHQSNKYFLSYNQCFVNT